MRPDAKRGHTDLLRSLIKELLAKTAALLGALELQGRRCFSSVESCETAKDID